MRIEKIIYNKKRFLNLLLLADEQEGMIDGYLERGDLFALYDDGDGGDGLRSVCVVAPAGGRACELKNLATRKEFQKMGYAGALLRFVFDYYKNKYGVMLVGTGECPMILSFYERCGFERSHRVKNFFVDNYDHPIFEGGVRLVDMIYLKRDL